MGLVFAVKSFVPQVYIVKEYCTASIPCGGVLLQSISCGVLRASIYCGILCCSYFLWRIDPQVYVVEYRDAVWSVALQVFKEEFCATLICSGVLPQVFNVEEYCGTSV